MCDRCARFFDRPHNSCPTAGGGIPSGITELIPDSFASTSDELLIEKGSPRSVCHAARKRRRQAVTSDAKNATIFTLKQYARRLPSFNSTHRLASIPIDMLMMTNAAPARTKKTCEK